MRQHAAPGVCPVGRRLNTLGITASADLDAFWKLVKVRDGVDRGKTIVGRAGLAKHFAVLLEGVACLSTQDKEGGRQIYALHYPGDFLGLHSSVLPSVEPSEVQALTSCSIGTIDRDALEQAIQRHPALGRALWRAALTEVSIFRQRLLVSRRPALQRVAHLLCEQRVRLGTDDGIIPLTQIDIADAAGLSSPRIVGWIMRTDSSDLPWHRVISASGRPAHHLATRQLELLRAEGVLARDGRVRLGETRHAF